MARNGNGSVVLDLSAIAADFSARQKRLLALSKAQADIGKRRGILDREQADLEREIQTLTGSAALKTPAKPQKVVKSTKPAGKKVGRPAKSAAAKAVKGTGRGMTTMSALLSVMPSNTEDGIDKDEAVIRVKKAGLDRNKVVIGQTLGGSNYFQNVERGKWRLTASGVKARDKAANATVTVAAPVTNAATIAAPQITDSAPSSNPVPPPAPAPTV